MFGSPSRSMLFPAGCLGSPRPVSSEQNAARPETLNLLSRAGLCEQYRHRNSPHFPNWQECAITNRGVITRHSNETYGSSISAHQYRAGPTLRVLCRKHAFPTSRPESGPQGIARNNDSAWRSRRRGDAWVPCRNASCRWVAESSPPGLHC